jgi:hypothetical protein
VLNPFFKPPKIASRAENSTPEESNASGLTCGSRGPSQGGQGGQGWQFISIAEVSVYPSQDIFWKLHSCRLSLKVP